MRFRNILGWILGIFFFVGLIPLFIDWILDKLGIDWSFAFFLWFKVIPFFAIIGLLFVLKSCGILN